MIEREMIRAPDQINWTPDPPHRATANSIPRLRNTPFFHELAYYQMRELITVARRLCTKASIAATFGRAQDHPEVQS
jgi:hypothetical protein